MLQVVSERENRVNVMHKGGSNALQNGYWTGNLIRIWLYPGYLVSIMSKIGIPGANRTRKPLFYSFQTRKVPPGTGLHPSHAICFAVKSLSTRKFTEHQD